MSGEGRLGRYAYSACVDCVAVVKVRWAVRAVVLWLANWDLLLLEMLWSTSSSPSDSSEDDTVRVGVSEDSGEA